MKKITVLLFVVVLLVANVVTVSMAEDANDTIKIAVVGPMTGNLSQYGELELQGVNLAQSEINAAGGIDGRQIELVTFDDKCDPTEAALIAGRVVEDPSFDAVLGHFCSSATLAAGPIYEEAGMTFLTAISTHPDLCKHGWTHLFRTVSHDNVWGPVLAKLAVETLGKKNVGIFYTSNDWGQGVLNATEPVIKELGGNIAAVETFMAGDKDFSAQLSKIAKAGVDVLLVITDYTEAGLFARQRVAAGLGDVPIVGGTGLQYQEYIDLAGEAAEGTIATTNWNPWSEEPLAKEINQKLINTYHVEMPTESAVYWYEGVYVLAEAFKQGATRENLNDVLRTVKYVGPTGVTEFDETGDVKYKGTYTMIVKDGKWGPYYPD